MGKVFVVTSGKGGVGKTTTVANLGISLARFGRSVVMIDADIGLRNLDLIMGLENRIVYDLVDVIEGGCRLRQALIKDKRFRGLYLLPAAQTRDKSAIVPEEMRDLCRVLRRDFDFVLVDCPAGIEQGFRNSVAGAEEAVVVTTPEVAAVRAADRVIGLLQVAGIKEPRLVINRIRPRMVRRGDMLETEDILEILSIPVLGEIPEDEGVISAANRGEPLAVRGKGRTALCFAEMAEQMCAVPESKSVEVNISIFDRLLQRLGLGA